MVRGRREGGRLIASQDVPGLPQEEPAEPEEDEKGPERRCFVSGRRDPPAQMVRFVVSPDDVVVPDVEGRLPGRGMWLSAERDVVNTAVAKGLFSKAARRRVTIPPDLADQVEAQLARRCLDLLGFARRAGQAVAGFEKVAANLRLGQAALLMQAIDAAAGGRSKMKSLARSGRVAEVLSAKEIGRVFGRDHVVHVAVAPGSLADRIAQETARLGGFRRGPDS